MFSCSVVVQSTNRSVSLCKFLLFTLHKSFSWGHWHPCIGLLMTSGLGFKARQDPFVCFLTCVILRFTSGATPADCIWVLMFNVSFKITQQQIRNTILAKYLLEMMFILDTKRLVKLIVCCYIEKQLIEDLFMPVSVSIQFFSHWTN